MARRRKRKSNPRRRRRTRSRRRRRNPGALLVNPRKRRYRRTRRRNPASKGLISDLLRVAIPATIGGGILGFIDSKFLGTSGVLIRNGVKGGLALLFLSGIGRKYLGVDGSKAAAAGVIATVGHEIGVRLGGGMVAMTKEEGVDALIAMAVEDDEVAALIEGNYEGSDMNEIEDSIIAMESRAAQMEELGDTGDDYQMLARGEQH